MPGCYVQGTSGHRAPGQCWAGERLRGVLNVWRNAQGLGIMRNGELGSAWSQSLTPPGLGLGSLFPVRHWVLRSHVSWVGASVCFSPALRWLIWWGQPACSWAVAHGIFWAVLWGMCHYKLVVCGENTCSDSVSDLQPQPCPSYSPGQDAAWKPRRYPSMILQLRLEAKFKQTSCVSWRRKAPADKS